MQISEQDAKSWYETYGISDDDWDSYTERQKGMIGLEALADSWPTVVSIREVGMPTDTAIIHFDAAEIGLDPSKVLGYKDGESYESLTPYVLQNTTNDNLKSLLEDGSVNVLSVSASESSDGTTTMVKIECWALADDLFWKRI